MVNRSILILIIIALVTISGCMILMESEKKTNINFNRPLKPEEK